MLRYLTAHQFPEPAADGDPLALAIVVAVLLAFTVWVLVSKKKKATAVVAETAPVELPVAPLPKAPGSAGELKLHDVEPKTAAMLMAIVADKMGKPLNELRFISIKEVK